MSLSMHAQSTTKVRALLEKMAPSTAAAIAEKGGLNKHTVLDALRVLCANDLAHIKERPIHKDTGRYTNVYAVGTKSSAAKADPFWWCGNRLR